MKRKNKPYNKDLIEVGTNLVWIVKLFAILKSDYLRLSDERIQILFA